MAAAKAPAKRKATKTRARKTATKKVEATPEAQIEVQSPEPQEYDSVWHAKLEAYDTLKSVGAPIPEELAREVEDWLGKEIARLEGIKAAKNAEAQERAEADEKGPKWVRNLRPGPFSVRLDRQQEEKRKIELQPRGKRGDMHPLQPGDENDHSLIGSLGFVEIIGNTEAQEVLEKQTTNIQHTDTTLAMLTNSKGEPLQRLVVETEFNKQGVTVAYVDPAQQQRIAEGEFGKSRAQLGDLSREKVSQFIPTGGNPAIISSGFQPAPSPPGMTSDAQANVQDQLARLKGLQGRPEQVLGLSVSVDPVQQG